MTLDEYFMQANGGERVFTVEAPRLKFGPGAISELGEDAKELGMSRVGLFTDPRVAVLGHVDRAVASLEAAGLSVDIFSDVEVEPTDRSFLAAAEFAREGKFDGYVSVGGGSTIDTAKAANLLATYPGDLMTYTNAPIGEARPVPGLLRPHIACPTTFGTASECTGIAVYDILDMGLKTGIAHRALRPSLGIIDPDALATLPVPVVAANGFDVFSHAAESYTAKPFGQRPAPAGPAERPLSQGANPYSDLACLEAIRLVAANLESALDDPENIGTRQGLAFAGMLAGIGFGNAGCHVPHAMSYSVAGLAKDYQPDGWPDDHIIVPHGISVIVNSPAVFLFNGAACPERHLRAAEALGADVANIPMARSGEILAERLISMMRATGMPNGLAGLGYGRGDLDALTERALPQRRLLDIGPRNIDRAELRQLFENALTYW